MSSRKTGQSCDKVTVDTIKIGQRLYATRKEKNMTLQDVADLLGVARSTIQRYEKGRIDGIKLPVIEAMAKCLGVNPAWILYKSDKKELESVNELTFDDFDFALHGEVRELDEEAKAEILKTAQRFNELRKLKEAAKKEGK